ncbi:MAG: HEAT repeat domain-containing protein, partial [Cyclobacteriaceae bacterium]|nr:HEAT repeat domain-containing protein [Cyclobacteriaceae bacterium]
VHQLALKAAGEADDFDAISLPADKLEKMGKSLQKEDRLVAARVLRTMMDDKTIFLLLELLRDIDNEVRLEAIITARKVKRPETWSVLIEMLDSPNFGHAANSALIVAGEDALHTLEMAFHKSGQRDKIMLKIISIIGRIGGEKSLELLWKKIDYPDKRISSQVLVWLRYFNYQARTERERQTLFELLDDDIAKAIWNMSALVELPDQEHFKLLKESLEEEVGANYAHIFMLLSILYDPNSIQLVRENIESGSSEGITFAIELMDIFVDKEVKPKLFPLFDDIETIDKLRQLQVFFPREEYTANEVLNFILNRNFDQANRWTKACALHALAFMDDFKVTKAMVAQLFNPDYLLQETAAWVIYHKEKTIFEKVAIRLPEEDRKFLENSISRNQLIEGLDDGAFLRIEMAMFMKEVPLLSAIRGALLCDIADHMQVIQLAANEEYILSDQLENKPILVIAGGDVELTYNEMEKTNLQVKDVFGDLFVLDANLEARHLQAITDSIIFSISATDFYTIMGDNLGLVQDMIAGMTTQFEKEKILT